MFPLEFSMCISLDTSRIRSAAICAKYRMSFAIFPRGGHKKRDAFACECDVIDVITSEHRSELAVNAFCKIQQLTFYGDTLVIADGWCFLDG